ncbi:MAG: hypothetical protein QGG40_22530, partial [Myxococcota bacterium]|nr:hypothetical protein [Myxococcota bacterium]
AALDAALRGERWGLALLAGAALSCKYTTAGILVGIFLVARLPWGHRVVAGVIALALVSPWWARNLAEGLHPLFPFAGWPEVGDLVFQYREKYGAGRDLVSMAMLPWNVVITAEPDSFRFLGKLNPAWLALAPGLVWSACRPGVHRRILVAGAIGGLAWAVGPHWLQYLLPTLPILALGLTAGTMALNRRPMPARLAFGALFVAWVAGLPSNWGPLLERASDRLPSAMGGESREDFLEREFHGYSAVAWANEHLPEDARVALLFNWSGYLLERDWVLSSVEDHVPSRYWLFEHGEDTLDVLADQGVTHLLVSRVHFIQKVYPFLDTETFERTFRAP